MTKDSKEDEVKTAWFNAVEIEVEQVTLELSGMNNELVHRVRLTTDIGDVTYKPRKKTEVSGKIGGFNTTSSKNELFTISEFSLEFPVFKVLSDDTSEGKQKVTISYGEIVGDKGEVYKYMRDAQAKTLYYPKFHKDTKDTLDRQLEKKEKFKKGSL